jgi:hypothetical protein
MQFLVPTTETVKTCAKILLPLRGKNNNTAKMLAYCYRWSNMERQR